MYTTCICVLLYMSCVTNILTTVKYYIYDELLRKVKTDHYVHKIWLLKIWKKEKNLKRYDRLENTVCTLFARREQAATTTCATYKHHGRYKDAVETSCGQCRDAVRTLCFNTFYICDRNKNYSCQRSTSLPVPGYRLLVASSIK